MEELPPITYSPLQRSVEKDGETFEIHIYRGENDPGWLLEVVDEARASHCWNDLFESDREALDAALRTIENGELEEDDGGDLGQKAELDRLDARILEERGEGEGGEGDDALSDDDRFNAALRERGKSPSWAEGFFVALHTVPQLIPASVWLDVLFDGQFPEAKNEKDAQALFELLFRRYGEAVDETKDDVTFFSPDPEDEDACREWASGYLVGISVGDVPREELMPNLREIAAISMVAGTLGEDGVREITKAWQKMVTEKGLSDASEEAMMAAFRSRMENHTLAVYERFREARMAGARAASGSLASDKVPRNAPCPCGSGKKHKKCCLV